MKILILNVSYGSLNAGEEAGFPNDEANEMIAKGIGLLIRVEDGDDIATEPEKASAEPVAEELPAQTGEALPPSEPEKASKKK
jgi:hypothetical protein